MPLNPNAPSFSFNPNASEFVPFSPAAAPAASPADPEPAPLSDTVPDVAHSATNGVDKKARDLKLSKDAPTFVPGGSTSAAPGDSKEKSKGASAPSGKSWASLAASKAAAEAAAAPKGDGKPDPITIPTDAPTPTPSPAPTPDAVKAHKPHGHHGHHGHHKSDHKPGAPKSGDHKPHHKAAALPVKPAGVPGARYDIKTLLETRSRATPLDSTRFCMSEFKRTLEETPELDPSQEMPARPQSDQATRGSQRQNAGGNTPKKGGGRGGNKVDAPLRDKTGKILEVKALEVTENRWKPSKPTDEEEKVFKAVKGLLNKLTLEKFDKLYGDVLKVGITNASLLKGFVVVVYDKAVLEPTFISMYAKMCQRLAEDLPEFVDETDGSVLPFNEVLVGKCRAEFEQMGNEPELQGIEELSEDDRNARLRKLRLRTLGNVEFIGELFKLKMVGLEEVNLSITMLLPEIKKDAEKIQPLVKLLEGVGKIVEEKDKEGMDKYFAVLEEVLEMETLSSRFKFMLMDLKDLRAKGWVPRRAAEGPKLLEEVQKEVDKENRYTEKKKDKDGDPKTPKKGDKGRERKPKKEMKSPVQDDGWCQVEKVGLKAKTGGKNDKRVKGKKDDKEPASPITAARSAKMPTKSSVSMASKGGFAALMADDDDKSEEESEEESEESVEEVKAPEKHGPELNDEAANKVGYILEEFMCTHDVEEAVECMVDLHQMEKYSKALLDEEVVRRGLLMALDNSAKECTLMAKMFAGLIQKTILQPDDASRGICDVFKDLDDIAIDIPKAPEMLASITKDMIDKGLLNKGLIANGVKELIDTNSHGAKHFEEVLTATQQ